MKVLVASTPLTGRINPTACTAWSTGGHGGLSSVGRVASSASLATTPAAGLRRLSLNENPFGPSPLAVEAVQNALTEIARYPGDDAHALEQQIAYREGVSPNQIILGEIL